MSSSFDVVGTYTRLLAEDADLTMPVAAIEALILGLAATPASTAFETLDLVSTLTAELKRRIPNSVSLTAGTDLFQKYLEASLRGAGSSDSHGGGGGGGDPGDFGAVRAHLVQNGKLVVENAKAAREQAAGHGVGFVAEGDTVLTNGGSRVVGTLLRKAAERGRRFRVVHVGGDGDGGESAASIRALRAARIPVAVVPATAVAYSMARVAKVFVGAEGVVRDGGIVSRMGTYQLAELAKAHGKPVYVVAETHKFTRMFPATQYDLGFEQHVLDFQPGEEAEDEVVADDEGVADVTGASKSTGSKSATGGGESAVDYTPPHLIAAVITEIGVKPPAAVADMITKMWM